MEERYGEGDGHKKSGGTKDKEKDKSAQATTEKKKSPLRGGAWKTVGNLQIDQILLHEGLPTPPQRRRKSPTELTFQSLKGEKGKPSPGERKELTKLSGLKKQEENTPKQEKTKVAKMWGGVRGWVK